ncbi:hypothetical protein VPH35_005977 [Triticum aestivum]
MKKKPNPLYQITLLGEKKIPIGVSSSSPRDRSQPSPPPPPGRLSRADGHARRWVRARRYGGSPRLAAVATPAVCNYPGRRGAAGAAEERATEALRLRPGVLKLSAHK